MARFGSIFLIGLDPDVRIRITKTRNRFFKIRMIYCHLVGIRIRDWTIRIRITVEVVFIFQQYFYELMCR